MYPFIHCRIPHALVITSSLVASLFLGACQKFDAPPRATLPEAVDGILGDTAAPIVVAFSEPVAVASLSLKIISYDTSIEGDLHDEDADDETELSVLFLVDGATGTQEGGKAVIDASRMVLSIALDTELAVGAKWGVIIEPGLSDDQGNSWQVRQHLVFGYELTCEEGSGTDNFPSGTYFWLVQVDSPVSTQIQLWSAIEVDAASGKFVGQFTNGERNLGLDCSTHGLSCKATEVCRTLPEPECVTPSERAGSIDEYPDWGFLADTPAGYSFAVEGCLKEQPDGSIAFANSPADIIVEQPPVDVVGASFNASFSLDAEKILRGSGTFTAEQVLIGGSPSGAGVGTHEERQVPDSARPDGLPTHPSADVP
jgi:hypothetical protein